MASTTIQFFKYEHLPEPLKRIAKPIAELAQWMEENLPDGPEKSAGMRKLLEAKDCFVRTMLPDGKPINPDGTLNIEDTINKAINS